MAPYVFDGRSVTGHPGIDAAHARIAELSVELDDLLAEIATFERVYDVFRRLHQLMFRHFELEERFLAGLPDTEEVRSHVRKHKADHQLFRDTFTYADDQFRAKRGTGEIPNITELIPAKYFEELKQLDAEMTSLFETYGIREN